jgi:hypothetical protein
LTRHIAKPPVVGCVFSTSLIYLILIMPSVILGNRLYNKASCPGIINLIFEDNVFILSIDFTYAVVSKVAGIGADFKCSKL